MKIETGKPTQTGMYAVYTGGDTACYAARFWLNDGETGWLTNLKEPLPEGAEITGWIGPLPLREAGKGAPAKVQYNEPPKTLFERMSEAQKLPIEYDL